MIAGYAFQNPVWFERACRHTSFKKRGTHFEGLEFLGDRVLGLVVADWLLEQFPQESEGTLAKRFAVLTNRSVLASVANDIGLENFLEHDYGMCAQSGHRVTLLSDACEALMGAMYRDGGLQKMASWVRSVLKPYLNEKEVALDAKTVLQEKLQGQHLPLPVYVLLERSGLQHAPVFRIGVTLHNGQTFEGAGSSKQKAQQAAAENALKSLS